MSVEATGVHESTGQQASLIIRHDEHPVRKRKRLDESDSHVVTSHAQIHTPYKKLAHNDYTVAWVCALPLELTAARIMLDEEHLSLPNSPGDQNTYVLGRISTHNVVITCLPAGNYGNSSAAEVAAQLATTFRFILYPLLVGIGGGVPQSGYDIRLGDVVVSMPTSDYPAVVQYDFGKMISNGVFQHQGHLNSPKLSLLKTVSNVKSKYDLRKTWHSQVPVYIGNALHDLDGATFAYPGAEQDVLFDTECDHVLKESACDECGPPKPKDRLCRQDDRPRIHYGTIASGNKVIKHARTRDSLAQQHHVLCFEMEAAALMNSLSCLVIRGICDYCDSKKMKQFQGYAALTAAAYAKEFILHLPEAQQSTSPVQATPINEGQIEHRRIVMEALRFDEADNRRATVRRAHSNTCKWIMNQEQYCNWVNPTESDRYHGLLWIKGKAGSGKSTLVKFLLEETNKSKTSNHIVISFFFNARGQDLEKSTLGLYRSLLYQILIQMPELQTLLDHVKINEAFNDQKIGFLKNCFESILKMLESRELVCFIDALDECPEEQVRDMVSFFEELEDLAAEEINSFRVCFSSRHYPNIMINTGEELILENEVGHCHDMKQYISKNIVSKTKLRQLLQEEILQKANGIFLWIVLVVQILNRDYARGDVSQMRTRLESIPQELDDLFGSILTRDDADRSRLLLCIQWTLYSGRPLHLAEFYFAMRSGEDDFNGGFWDPERIDISLMENYILTSSKGLVELTRGEDPVVQFIHESVREYLRKPNTLLSFWPDLEGISKGPSHNRLKVCCYQQVLSCNTIDLWNDMDLPFAMLGYLWAPEKAQRLYPFVNYATNHVLYHSYRAAFSGEPQTEFLHGFDRRLWARLDEGIRMQTNVRKYLFFSVCGCSCITIIWECFKLYVVHIL